MSRIIMLLAGTALGGSALAQTPPPAAAAQAQQWTVRDFAALPLMERPSLSPDGLHIASRVAVNGEQRLVIADVYEGPNRIRSMGLGDNDLNWWKWVNDDWLIAGVGNESNVQGMPWYLSRVVSIKRDGSKVTLLAKNAAAQNADDVIWIARDGSPRILLSYQTSIYYSEPGFWPKVDEIDISTGRMRSIVAPRQHVRGWYADAGGTVRMGVGYNDASRTSTLLYRADGRSSFRVVDRANRRRDESMVVPLLFTADPGKAIASDDHEGADALYEYDLGTLELGRKIFAAPGFDLGGIEEDAAGTGLAGVRYTADAPAVHWFDPNLAKIQADIDKAVGDRRARIISTSRDGQKMIVHVGTPDQPGAYYYYDTAAGAMSVLSRVSDQFPGKTRLSPVKTIRYKARDGLEIAAVLTLPAGREAKDLPLILMPHGGPFARDSEEWDWWVQFLAWRGYAVLQPNYRGSAGYGTAFAEKGEGQWGLAMQDDLNDAVDWAVGQGIADAKRVCMVGASYGGYAAMRAAQRDGGRYRCAMSYAGVSDLAAMMRYDGRFLYHGTRKDWMKEQAPDFTAVSPVNFAAQFSTPILLMHGKKDRRVQVNQSREMAEKLKAAGKVEGRDYIYAEQPLADHFFSREADRIEFLEKLDAFLKEHNPA
ncbi:prolyl oligopeptidase family serine peptidase [Sphingobium sp. 3R8]|uniref:alpha/beta hydrolase family protein n=1 Tax=Sphingobium sp. 3R8 TaxID=2874921 RepID=UPI001CCBB13C|nr:alpha/beta fold hydrolase [Sphingobium sp. 3R8]MBZ9649375.1 prolyl oligopeptidase family serine peptidase [Sphingobium sp. 3R8]